MRASVALWWMGLLLLLTGRVLAQPSQPAGLPGSLASTSQLVSDPKLAAWIDALLARGTVDLSRFGPENDQDRLLRLLSQIEAATTPAQRLALLRHKSPTVRGYVIHYWLPPAKNQQEQRDALPQIEPLLMDDSEISTRIDCRSKTVRICDLVLQKVQPSLFQNKLAQVAQRESGCQLSALRVLAVLGHPLVPSLAAPLLDRSDNALQVLGLELLGRVPRPEHAARVRALTSSSDVKVRARAASALHAWPQPENEALLRRLMEQDPSALVRALAAQSYVQQPTRDLAWIEQWGRRSKPSIRHALELGLVYDGRSDALALVRSLLIPRNSVSSDFWFDAAGYGYTGSHASDQFFKFLLDVRKESISKELADKIDQCLKTREEKLNDISTRLQELDFFLNKP